MKYMGSKRRIAKYIKPIILDGRKAGQRYVEPSVGGANMLETIEGPRIGADINPYLIAMFQAQQKGWTPPEFISENRYLDAKNYMDSYKDVPHYIGYLGFAFSFGAKFFGGYRRHGAGSTRSTSEEAYRGFIKQTEKIKGVEFICCEYSELVIPKNSIIYCDPPYQGTTKYKDGGFNHSEFWQWCRDKTDEGHSVYISEYSAPDDFTAIWEGENSSTFGAKKAKKATEKLFIYI